MPRITAVMRRNPAAWIGNRIDRNASKRQDFKDFILRGNVGDLAAGIIIAAAFGKIMSSLVNGPIMPPVGRCA